MRDQTGTSLLEVTVAIAILALVSAFAALAGISFLSSTKTSKASTEFADSVSMARESAIARYERWRIRFVPHPVAGSGVIRDYVLESCTLDVDGSVDCTDPADWVQQKPPVRLPEGVGLISAVETLAFDRNGRFMEPDLTFQVCPTFRDVGNAEFCRSGSNTRTIKIRRFSGIIES